MKSKYFNLFWIVVSTIVIFNEFLTSDFQFLSLENIMPITWILVSIWSIIAIKNAHSLLKVELKKA